LLERKKPSVVKNIENSIEKESLKGIKINIKDFMDLWPKIKNGLKLVQFLTLVAIGINIFTLIWSPSYWLFDIINLGVAFLGYTVSSLVLKLVGTIDDNFGGMMV